MKMYLFVLCSAIFFTCRKNDDNIIVERARSYVHLTPGSIFLYRLDSFVTKPNSSSFEKHSYSMKDSILSESMNGTGARTFITYRFLRDTLNNTDWKFATAYEWTMNEDNIEVTENNLRFIKLVSPVEDGKAWKGNIYIDTYSSGSPFYFLNDWNYAYQSTGKDFMVRKGLIPNTVTVMQADEMNPNTNFSPSLDFQEKNYSVEVYAKNIGLIFKEYFHYTWQKNPTPNFQQNSYGITLNLVDYKLK